MAQPSLVTLYGVSGKKTHDTKLVAAMIVHGVTHVLTYNVDDFTRFSEISTIHPDSL